MKIKVYPLVWDTDNGTGCIIYPTFKEGLRALIQTALEYAENKEQTEILNAFLGDLADGENPEDVRSRFSDQINEWTNFSGYTFWGRDTQYLDEAEIEIQGDALVKFNPYPATRPAENCNYLALLSTGFTESLWWDGEGWQESDFVGWTGPEVTGWAELPTVPEAPKARHYVLVVRGDIEPQLIGPFETPGERDEWARTFRQNEGKDHGLYPVDSAGAVSVDSYSGGFFDE